jgi:hypothetical protein
MADMKVQREKERMCVCMRTWQHASFGKYTFHLVEVFQED